MFIIFCSYSVLHDVGCLLHIYEVPINVFCSKLYRLLILSFHSILSTCIELLFAFVWKLKMEERELFRWSSRTVSEGQSIVRMHSYWLKTFLNAR